MGTSIPLKGSIPSGGMSPGYREVRMLCLISSAVGSPVRRADSIGGESEMSLIALELIVEDDEDDGGLKLMGAEKLLPPFGTSNPVGVMYAVSDI